MPAGSIVIDLLMRTGSFETDTRRAEAALKRLEKDAVAVGKAMGVAFAAAATATAVLVKSSIDAADEAAKLARSVGVSVEELTSLAHAADLSGVSQDELGAVMTRLARLTKDAADGGKEAAATFRQVGIALRDAGGNIKGQQQLLGELADVFAGMPDGIEKTALATEFFGKSGARLIPLLQGGSKGLAEMAQEARALGLVLDSQLAAQAEAFNDDLTRMGNLARGLGNDLARELLPVLTEVSAQVVDMGKAWRESGAGIDVAQTVSRGLLTVFQAIAVIGSDVVFVFQGVGREIGGIAAQIAALMRLDLTGFRAISDAMKDDAVRARAELDALQRRIMQLGSATPASYSNEGRNYARPGAAAPPFRLAASGGRPAAAPKQSEADRYLESLQKQLQATRELTVTEKLLDDIQAGRLGKVSAQQQQALVGVARQIDAAKAAAQAWEDEKKAVVDAFKADGERREALTREAAAVFEATRTPAEQLAAEIARLNALLDAGVISWDTYARAQFAAQDAFDEASKQAKKAADDLDEFAKNAAENIQRSLGDTLVDAMNGNWKGIGDGFKQMLDRMVAEALAANITRALFGEAGNGGGLLGDLLPALGSFLGFGGARAGGGSVDAGRAYLVGEQGPELFVPRTAGRVYNAPQTAAAGASGMQVQQTFVVQGTPDRRTQAQLAAAAAQGLARAASRMN